MPLYNPGGGGVTLDSTAGDIAPLGSQAAGAVGKAADAGHVHAMPTLDQPGVPAGNVSMNSHKITSLANGTAVTDAAAFGQVVSAVASTGASGTALVNGTPTILTWTAPNDGLLHRVFAIGALLITVNTTGGQITLNFTDPGGNVRAQVLVAAGLTVGNQPAAFKGMTVQAGTAVTVTQTALTGGTATLYMDLWAS